MKSKLLVILLTLVLIFGFSTIDAAAETTVDAPVHFAVKHYQGDYFNFTASAPESLRTIIDQFDLGKVLVIKTQIDYKLGSGDWQYDSSWDTAKFGLANSIGFSYIKNECYISQSRASLSVMFPDDAAALQDVKDSGWDFPNEAISFRVRFVTSLDSNKTYLYSPWSETYVYSSSVVSDPDKLIDHAPTLTSAVVGKNTAGMPFLKVITGRVPGDVQLLNAMTGDSVCVEIWMRRAGETQFKLINTPFARNEYIMIGVSDYFDKTKPSYDEEAYEIKVRYVLNDLRKYPQAGRSDIIYSPFSNIISQNMPAWSNASAWAEPWLIKAEEYNLISGSLVGVDMTKPITRGEFAALSVELYESLSGKAAVPVASNPFTDTEDTEVLKAFNIGITNGTSLTTFSPNDLISREQTATMLTRAYKAAFWEEWTLADDPTYTKHTLNYSGVATFADNAAISAYAKPSVYFMVKNGIIDGVGNNMFAPNTSNIPASAAANYGRATREQAVKIAVASIDNLG
jgi:hypothetical protein